MSKVVTSPVAQFPGTVTLAAPLSLLQVVAWSEAVAAAAAARGEAPEPGKPPRPLLIGEASVPRVMLAILPGVLACVERWNLAGFPETVADAAGYPFTPLEPAGELAAWLVGQINAVIVAETVIPKA